MTFYENNRFPVQLSYGASGGPMYDTSITRIYTGSESRIGLFKHPLHKYRVKNSLQNKDKIFDVRSHFLTVKGPENGFRFKDWSDFKSCARDQIVSATDQVIGNPIGGELTFQLVKTYTVAGSSYIRPITKPVIGTVIVSVNDIEVFNFTIDPTTGLVTFTIPPGPGSVVKAGYEFDVPVRYEKDLFNIRRDGSNSYSYNIELRELRIVPVVQPINVVYAQQATITSTANALKIRNTVGNVQAQQATITNSAQHIHNMVGDVQAQPASVTGIADWRGVAGNAMGSVQAQQATDAGTADYVPNVSFVTITISFSSDDGKAELFKSSGTEVANGVYDGTDGNPAGSVRFDVGNNVSSLDQKFSYWDVSHSFEYWGVPVGTTIQSISNWSAQAKHAESGTNGTHWPGVKMMIGFSTAFYSYPPSAQSGNTDWATLPLQTDNSSSLLPVASTALLDFQLDIDVNTGADGTCSVYYDNITFDVYYT